MNWRCELQRQFEVLEHFRKIGGDAYRKADEYCYRFGIHFLHCILLMKLLKYLMIL